MRTRDALERLAAAEPVVELPVDAGEEERILERILASDRVRSRRRPDRRPVLALLLAGAVVAAAAAVAATGAFRSAGPHPRVVEPARHHRVVLTGPRIELAGYHFRTPAGFKASKSSCPGASSGSGPTTVLNGFASAASAEGGCVEAFLMRPGSPSAPNATPADTQPVDVGSYQGYIASAGSDGGLNLYVELAAGPPPHPYLLLYAQGLDEEQLIAVAVSGLPASPTATGTTGG